MYRTTIEENNAKCNVCSAGLSMIEVMLYGNRCYFCVETKRNVGIIELMTMCYYDWRIYQTIWRLTDRVEGDRMSLLGCLGAIGYTDINQVKSVKDKKALLKELRGLKNEEPWKEMMCA